MFVAYKGFRIVADDHHYEVRDPEGRPLGRYPSMTAAVQAINALLHRHR